MTSPDTDPQHDLCLPCRIGRCLGCKWGDRFCGHDCGWLVADVWLNFPSLRRIWIEETEDQ